MDDHQHDGEGGGGGGGEGGGGGGGGGGAVAAFEEEVMAMMKKKYYREASECLKTAMEAYPEDLWLKKYGFCLLIISETLHYESIILPLKCDYKIFDYYSVLHLPPSSTYSQVKDRFFRLRDELDPLKHTGFNDVTLAESLLYFAKSNLCEGSIRADFDAKRKDCVFLDWPNRQRSNRRRPSFRESYLDWKPPVYSVDAIHLMKSAHDDDDDDEVGVEVKDEVGEEEEEESDDDDDESDDEEEEEASLSPELRILKKKVFDEMPQKPHYTPLGKYSGKLRQGMILGLEVAFTKLCEEIKNLVDVQSFWDELDGFNEEISQLKQMGYNMEKVSKRIDILKNIAELKRASRAAAKKCENEVRDRVAKVINLQTYISELQNEIEESKSKIEPFKKDSNDAVAKFAAIAKSKWV